MNDPFDVVELMRLRMENTRLVAYVRRLARELSELRGLHAALGRELGQSHSKLVRAGLRAARRKRLASVLKPEED